MRILIILILAAVLFMTPVLAAGDANALHVQFQTGVKETLKPQEGATANSDSAGAIAKQSGSLGKDGQNAAGETGKSNISGGQNRVNNMLMVIQQEQQALDEELSSVSGSQQEVLQNQNRVRLAVRVLQAACEAEGELGPQIISISDGINQSVMSTVRAEEKIRERNWLLSIFAGGDSESAGEIIRQVEENRLRLEELRQLIQQGEFSEDEITILQEQLMNIETEQERLRALAEEENKNKGIFGIFFQ